MSRSEVLLLVTGSIAAYKSGHIVSRLTQAGVRVQVVASPAALNFVGAATWEGLSGVPVVSSLWTPGQAMDHIHLVRKADLILAAPATAHFINRIASGVGDDLLTNMFLAHDFKKPFLVAPAMNTSMYINPVTQKSIQSLREMGLEFLESESGVLACGEQGQGRLLDPDKIVAKVLSMLPKSSQADTIPTHPRCRVLITSGGTREKIDDVRSITNTSTGRTGAFLASALVDLGFDVTIVGAKNSIRPERDEVSFVEFESFDDLQNAVRTELSSKDYSHVIHAAAVSDYRVSEVRVNDSPVQDHKVPSGADVTLRLTPTPKVIASLKSWSRNKELRVAGFKLTSKASNEERRQASDKVLEYADLVVGNDLSEIDTEKGLHPFHIYSRQGERSAANATELSAILSDWILEGVSL